MKVNKTKLITIKAKYKYNNCNFVDDVFKLIKRTAKSGVSSCSIIVNPDIIDFVKLNLEAKGYNCIIGDNSCITDDNGNTGDITNIVIIIQW